LRALWWLICLHSPRIIYWLLSKTFLLITSPWLLLPCLLQFQLPSGVSLIFFSCLIELFLFLSMFFLPFLLLLRYLSMKFHLLEQLLFFWHEILIIWIGVCLHASFLWFLGS
jgi:hypothetical protein